MHKDSLQAQHGLSSVIYPTLLLTVSLVYMVNLLEVSLTGFASVVSNEYPTISVSPNSSSDRGITCSSSNKMSKTFRHSELNI